MGLKVENVKKSYGTKLAVNNISFNMDKPGVFGLLGANGAGKSTTIRMILGIIKKDEGKITWKDKEVIRENVNFGYLPEERGIYPKTTIYNQLMYFGKLKGVSKAEADKSIKYWLERLGLEEYINMDAEKLSKGNQQKVQFVTAVMHDPELIILDEPFSGLDPINTEMLKSVMAELVDKGKYIIMSSHQMATVEEFCQEVIILSKGQAVVQGNLLEIKNSYPSNKLELITAEDVSKELSKLNLRANVKTTSQLGNNYLIEIEGDAQAHEVFALLAKEKASVIKFEIKKPSLHDIFVEKVGAN